MVVVTPGGHALGVVFAPPDPRNWPYALTAPTPPPDIDWRARMRPVGDQSTLGSCTGWGGTAAVEAARQDGIQRSPLYLYYRDRQEDGTPAAVDGGATMLALCKALKDYGVPPEDAWPYVPSRFSQAPSAAADAAAAACKIEAYYQVQGTGLALLQGLWAALQEGPCPIALNVFQSFETRVGADGKVPMPASNERVLGGHCICACMWFNDTSAPGGYGWVGCQNSWGATLGQDGYYFLPAGYFIAGIVQEAWVVKLAAAPPEPEPTVDVDAIRDRVVAIRGAVGRAQADRCAYSAPKATYQTSMATIMDHDIGPIDDLAREIDELLGKVPPGPGPDPTPAPQFVAPIPPGAVYGASKWLLGSLGADMFCQRGTPVMAPADSLVEEVIGGQGISGGAEIILATADKAWAWRYRHVQASVQVGQQVKQGQPVGQVYDASLDMLCTAPVASYPDHFQHCDLSVCQGTDRFNPQGGGGGNVSAYAWLQSIGYVGTVVQRTPGPPDCGMGHEDAVRFMTPWARRG